ncbi:MAG: hypothetical protein ACK526_03060 [Planctomyces sp.]|jgi:hypothetical protein
MKISIHVDSSLPPHAAELIERRCESAFHRFSSVIDDVFVTLTDENGPKGGDSIQCVLRVRQVRHADVIIHTHADIFERAFGLALDRAAYQVSRSHGRRQHGARTLRRGDVAVLQEAVPA